jgi:protein SCO1
MQLNRRSTLWALAACAAVTGLGLGACSPEAPQFESIDITGAEYANRLELSDSAGRVRNLNEFAGRVVVIFFGYTQCPDVCPTTLSEMSAVKKSLGSEADKLQVVFVSLDPERDTPELLQSYMANFDPSFLALRPTLAQLPEVAQHFKIHYKKVDGKTPNSYTLEHSAGSYVLDTHGRVRLFMRYGTSIASVTHDIRQLLQAS